MNKNELKEFLSKRPLNKVIKKKIIKAYEIREEKITIGTNIFYKGDFILVYDEDTFEGITKEDFNKDYFLIKKVKNEKYCLEGFYE